MVYSFFKFIHLLGVVALVGNVTVTAVWKVFADRTQDARTVFFAQRLVTSTDWVFTAGGALLTAAGGYGMAWAANIYPVATAWLFWGQILFVTSGVVWIGLLIPIQCAQARIASTFDAAAPIPSDYRRLGRRWIAWGIVATVPLVAAMFLMVAKP